LFDKQYVPEQTSSEQYSKELVKNLEELLQDILYQELKPKKKVLVPAAKSAYDMSSVEATFLADAILKALAFCRLKSKSMTSGAKLPLAVVNIINLLKKLGNKRLGTQLRVGAYKLAQEQPEDSPVLPCAPPTSSQSPTSPPSGSASKTRLSPMTRLKTMSAIFGVTPPRAVDDTLVESSPELDQGTASCSSLVAASQKENGAELDQGKAEEKKGKESSPLVFMDSSVRCLCKLSGGTKVFATMEPGPLGFAVGTFSDGMRQVSTMPNCMLTVCKQQKKKAMKAMKAMKKQATKEKKAKPETKQAMKATKKQAMKEKEAMPEAKQAMKATKKQAMKVMKKPCAGVSYCIMLYKKSGARALRIQGGKQLFQIKTAVPGQSQLILEEARDRMQAGGQLEDVMAWAKTQATP
jgi:hypothetical protein